MASYYKQDRLGWIEALVAGIIDTVEGVAQISTSETGKGAAAAVAYQQEQQTLYEQEVLRRQTEGLSAISREEFEGSLSSASKTTMKTAGIVAIVLGAYWLSSVAYKRRKP
jgi:hypothetical protein